MLEADSMLDAFQNEFEVISRMKNEKDKTRLLAALMTKMESWYKLSMNKARFEAETNPKVKKLYLEISAARNL